MREIVKKIRYIFEAPLVWLGLIIFRFFAVKKAGDFAARLAVFIGKKLKVTKLAHDNLSKALPHLNAQQKNQIIDDMWDNLGRIIAEFPHICAFSAEELRQYVEIDELSKQNISDLIALKCGGIIFSAHFGNWEIGPKILQDCGLEVSTVYRPLNNPWVEDLTASLRGVRMIEKGSVGSREIINLLKQKKFIIILADQKISEGEPIKFFHDDAITTTSIARLAIKYEVPLVPGYISRVDKNFNFNLFIEKPLEFNNKNSLDEEVINLTLKMNQKIEKWILSSPHQWFWVHNRWKK